MRDPDHSLFRRLFPADPRSFGEEPDYRFTLANERTFLAWIRTALALAAGGLGSISLLADEFAGAEAVGILLLALSFLTAGAAYRRWARAETSMRHVEMHLGRGLVRIGSVGSLSRRPALQAHHAGREHYAGATCPSSTACIDQRSIKHIT